MFSGSPDRPSTGLEYDGLKLPDCLQPGNESRAIDLLRYYYTAETKKRRPLFSGGQWDNWDPSGTRAASQNTFTSDDLTSLALLGVTVSGDVALQVLVQQRHTYEALLRTIPTDRDLVDVDDVSDAGEVFGPVWALWRELRTLTGMGPTKISKLLARKRPRVVPVYDSVLRKHVFPSGEQWRPLHAALRRETPHGRLHDRLEQLRRDAGLIPEVSPLRVFDVLAWLEGSRKGEGAPRS